MIGNVTGEAAGNGEADATAEALNESVDADDLAVDVDEGAATVSRVDVGVGLEEVLVHTGSLGAEDDIGAAFGADMAEGDAVFEAVGGADGDGKLADADFIGVGENCDWQVGCLDFEHGDVGLGIEAADSGIETAAILEADFDFFGILDDVAVCEDEAVASDDDVS